MSILEQRPRHPSGSPLREPGEHSGDSAFPALHVTPGRPGSLRPALGLPPRRDGIPAGVPQRVEERAGWCPAPGRGEPRKRRSCPDRTHLQVVLRQVLTQPRYLHILVQVQGRHFRNNKPPPTAAVAAAVAVVVGGAARAEAGTLLRHVRPVRRDCAVT